MTLEPEKGRGLTRNERWAFRKMAAHPEVVEQVIAESTDENPASRRRIMAAIRVIERRAVAGMENAVMGDLGELAKEPGWPDELHPIAGGLGELTTGRLGRHLADHAGKAAHVPHAQKWLAFAGEEFPKIAERRNAVLHAAPGRHQMEGRCSTGGLRRETMPNGSPTMSCGRSSRTSPTLGPAWPNSVRSRRPGSLAVAALRVGS